ncbi:hypothetical protein FACS1894188_10390 [Clostridia bacterium]|nr:hypothetical protein FACS1894188_10390 [Clostridia bacterium]
MNDNELFIRLFYFGTSQLGFSEDETWLMPLGQLLDLMACHRQFLGIDKPKKDYTLDDIL